MVSMANFVVAVSVWSTVGRMGTTVMPTRLHAIATDRHRTPARGVGFTAIDQEQPALRVGAWPEPPRAGDSQRIPGEAGAHRSPRPVDCQLPIHAVTGGGGSQGSGLEER